LSAPRKSICAHFKHFDPDLEEADKVALASGSAVWKAPIGSRIIFSIVVSLVSCLSLRAGGADEKAFTEKYKTALEAKDTATLESFLYTQGADPQIVEFYKMMQSSGAGGKIAKIELAALTADEAAKAAAPQESPTGGKICLTLKPTKKLVITTEQKSSEGSDSSTGTNFIAEKDGKFVIPVPGPCK
jgi:hypothetical protein